MNENSTPWKLRAFGLSDVGQKRKINEDAFYISEEQGLFLVCDGMGGEQAGALASQAVVQTLPLQIGAMRMAHSLDDTPEQAVQRLGRALGMVNDLLLEKIRDLPQVRGMGTTVVVFQYAGNGAMALAHLGDSRAYLMRRGFLELLTEDHTMAKLLLNMGKINKRKFRIHPMRHVLTAHIGMENCQPADVALLALLPGDRLLLCSDGLTNMLKDLEIGRILWKTPDPQAAAKRLIDRANEEGGNDNITALIIDITQPEPRKGRRRKKVIVRRKIGRSLRAVYTGEDEEEKEFMEL